MNILPYRNYQYFTDKTPQQLAAAFANRTAEFSYRYIDGYEFVGDVWQNGFKIFQNTPLYNKFRAVAEAQFADTQNGTAVNVTVKLNTFALVFCIVWLSSMAVLFLSSVLFTILGLENAWIAMLFSFVMTVFMIILETASYNKPARRFTKRIEEIILDI